MKRYELFDHTADIGVHIFGRTLEEIYANGAYALFDLLTNLKRVEEKIRLPIQAQGKDPEELLVRWLSELLFLFESKGFLIKKITVSHSDQGSIKGEARGEYFDPSRHERKMEIKAVTYHQLTVKKTNGIWKARVIFDV